LSFQDQLDFLVGPALPDKEACLEDRVQLVHLDLTGGQVFLEPLAVQVEQVFPDLSALLELPDFQVECADALQFLAY